MKKIKIVAVIPARMASTRFPGKPIADICGLPMIEHVRRRALLANGIDEVVVATCDSEIFDIVISFGGKAVMTADSHERSTERVAEAMESIDAEIVINAQGDEPLLLPEDLERVCFPFSQENDVKTVSLLSPLESDKDYQNPNIVKAACDQSGHVIYFSRAPIPYQMKTGLAPVFRETGIRAFRSDFLKKYVKFSVTPLEKVESIDMMRVIEHGYKIHYAMAEASTVGVDLVTDIEIIERLLGHNTIQAQLHRKISEEFA